MLKKILPVILVSFGLALTMSCSNLSMLSKGSKSLESCGPTNPCLTTAANAKTFFGASDNNGTSLWATDGTPEGTALVKKLCTGQTTYTSSYGYNTCGKIISFAAADGITYFMFQTVEAPYYYRVQIYRTTGKASETVQVSQLEYSAGDTVHGMPQMVEVGHLVYFLIPVRNVTTSAIKTVFGTVSVTGLSFPSSDLLGMSPWRAGKLIKGGPNSICYTDNNLSQAQNLYCMTNGKGAVKIYDSWLETYSAMYGYMNNGPNADYYISPTYSPGINEVAASDGVIYLATGFSSSFSDRVTRITLTHDGHRATLSTIGLDLMLSEQGWNYLWTNNNTGEDGCSLDGIIFCPTIYAKLASKNGEAYYYSGIDVSSDVYNSYYRYMRDMPAEQARAHVAKWSGGNSVEDLGTTTVDQAMDSRLLPINTWPAGCTPTQSSQSAATGNGMIMTLSCANGTRLIGRNSETLAVSVQDIFLSDADRALNIYH